MKPSPFLSYAREDSAFAMRLAVDLKAEGANVWLDQLDIRPGRQWDREIEQALTVCNKVIVILSRAAVRSNKCNGRGSVRIGRAQVCHSHNTI